MSRRVTLSILGAALVAGSLMAGVPAVAADVAIAIGGIAFGYNDGYWDREHHWHAWQNREEAEHWRAENREHYYARNHDRDKDQGWREKERYWDHH
jgi:hypothetical protein